MADNKFLPKLSQNLIEILDNDEEYYDITIEVGNDPYVRIFRAHMVILNYRSSYLRRILSTNKKKHETLVHIKFPSILPEIFEIILKYIYGGRLSLREYDTSDIIKILFAAKELNLQELIPHLQSFLIQNKSTWMEQNFNFVYQASFESDSFIELQHFCAELVSKEPEKFFKSPDFISISEKCLISLIQSNNLQMNEVHIWEHVLKWGFAQNPELSSDNLRNFSKDDFNALKNTLHQCIPLIKFDNLTSREFSDKVVPYKKILPKELYKSLLKGFLGNNNKLISEVKINEVKINELKINELKINDIKTQRIVEKDHSNIVIDSEIITNQHAELILKWIDRLEVTDNVKNSYKFKLIFRESHSSWTKFMKLRFFGCNPTISIIKLKNSNEILGGYNPIGWETSFFGSFGITKDSFIFSFTDGNILQDYVLSRVADENYAIYNRLDYGCSFGYSDLMIHGLFSDSNSGLAQGHCRKGSYEKPIRKTEDKFFVEKIEVFEIENSTFYDFLCFCFCLVLIMFVSYFFPFHVLNF